MEEQGTLEQVALTAEVLDALAHEVAGALDRGEDATAWAITCDLERLAGLDDDGPRPARPVIGRRFARAHGRLLALSRRAASGATARHRSVV